MTLKEILPETSELFQIFCRRALTYLLGQVYETYYEQAYITYAEKLERPRFWTDLRDFSLHVSTVGLIQIMSLK